MTIVIVGAGAIGLLVAGQLVSSPQRVVVVARPATTSILTQSPLHIAQEGQDRSIKGIIAISDPAELDAIDRSPELAILCVKGYDTTQAVPVIRALAPHALLTLQNGIGNEEILAHHFGVERIISGTITTSVEIERPNRITVTKVGGIGLAPMTTQTRIAPWVETFRRAGFRVQTYHDYRAMKWSKVLLNMLGNATAAILDIPVEAVYADRRLVALERRAFLEALHVMDRLTIRPVNLPRYPATWLARAIRYLPEVVIAPLLQRLVAGGRGGKPPSLHLDLARGNQRSEGALLYGAVARSADEIGIAAPVNHGLWETLNAIATGEVAWSVYQQQPEQLLKVVEQAESRIKL